jgi:hypothetical protein
MQRMRYIVRFIYWLAVHRDLSIARWATDHEVGVWK